MCQALPLACGLSNMSHGNEGLSGYEMTCFFEPVSSSPLGLGLNAPCIGRGLDYRTLLVLPISTANFHEPPVCRLEPLASSIFRSSNRSVILTYMICLIAKRTPLSYKLREAGCQVSGRSVQRPRDDELARLCGCVSCRDFPTPTTPKNNSDSTQGAFRDECLP